MVTFEQEAAINIKIQQEKFKKRKNSEIFIQQNTESEIFSGNILEQKPILENQDDLYFYYDEQENQNQKKRICLCLCKKKKLVDSEDNKNAQLIEEEINRIKSIECVICLETLESNKEIGEPSYTQFYKTFCNHRFHYKCLNSWIQNVK